MFVGKRVVCINNEDVESRLTVGETYKVVKEHTSVYSGKILLTLKKDDYGESCTYFSTRFNFSEPNNL
jgi:hypothetical protein